MTAFRKAIRVAFVGMIALVCGLVFAPASAFADSNFDADTINRSIVWVDVSWDGIVTVDMQDGTTQDFPASTVTYCTGWIVDEKGGIATAGHCVEKSEVVAEFMMASLLEAEGVDASPSEFDYTVRLNSPIVEVGQPSSIKDRVFTQGMVAQVINAQPFDAGDNALLRVANFDTSGAALQVANATPKVLDSITSIGFPADTGSISDVNRTNPTYKQGKISAQIVSSKGVPTLQVDGYIVSGMSGGPTLNEAGVVVGINSSGFGTSTQSYITDTETLRSFLSSNGVQLQSTPTTPSGDQSADSGAALTPPVNALRQTASESDDSGGVPVWVYVGGGVVALVGGAAVWKKLSKQSNSNKNTE